MVVSDNVSMFYGAKPEIFDKAADLRENMTEAENVIWEKLKNKKVFKYKFRRQHPVDIFIVDFYCHPLKLVIEIDGGYHLNKEQKEYDDGRTAELVNLGLKDVRFSNKEILNSNRD